MGDAAAFRGPQDPSLLLEPGDDAFDRRGEIIERHRFALALRRHDGSFVDQISEVDAGEARRQPGDIVEVDAVRRCTLATWTLRISSRPERSGRSTSTCRSKRPGSQQSRIEHLRAIGGADQDHALGDMCAEPAEGFRVTLEGDDLLQLVFRLVDAGDRNRCRLRRAGCFGRLGSRITIRLLSHPPDTGYTIRLASATAAPRRSRTPIEGIRRHGAHRSAASSIGSDCEARRITGSCGPRDRAHPTGSDVLEYLPRRAHGRGMMEGWPSCAADAFLTHKAIPTVGIRPISINRNPG
jgi:hypothetical protein